jgi:hypothetical protein
VKRGSRRKIGVCEWMVKGCGLEFELCRDDSRCAIASRLMRARVSSFNPLAVVGVGRGGILYSIKNVPDKSHEN